MTTFLSTTIELWPVERLIPYDRNTHSEEQIARSIREFGFTNPILVDVTIHRWQKFTGNPAVLSGDGRAFAEIARSGERPKGPGMDPRLP